MSDIVAVVRSAEVIAEEIIELKTEAFRYLDSAVRFANRQTFEIGKRLVEAKALIPPGEWLSWLKDSVDYSEDTAQNLMRIFNEYDPFVFENLSYSQMVALFSLPPADRRELVEGNDLSSMSTRDIKRLVKEKKEIESRLADTENKLCDSESKCKNLQKQSDSYKERWDSVSETLRKSTKLRQDIEADLKKTKEDLAIATNVIEDLKRSNKKVKTVVEERVVNVPSDEQIESLRAEISKEFEQKFEQLKSKEEIKQDPLFIETNFLFGLVQQHLFKISENLDKMDPEKSDKLGQALQTSFIGITNKIFVRRSKK